MIGPEELGASERTLWRSFADASPLHASPFLRPEFADIAGRVAPGARIAVLHRGGRIVGFLPHQMRGRAAQPLAAPLNDYHGFIMAPGEAPPTVSQTPDLIKADSFSVNGWVPADSAGESRKVLMADLTQGWEVYDARRREAYGKFFKDKDRARRSLARDRDGEVVTRVDVRDPVLLDELIAWKRDQYRRTRRHDVFACGWTVDVLKALMADHQGDFGASLGVMMAGDRPAAMEFSLHAGSRYHFWFPAYAADAARCSPGVLLTQDTMRMKSKDGFEVFDFGFAGEFYKKYFCDLEEQVTEATVFARPWRRAADRALATGPASRLTGSFKRRWAVVEACEITTAGRLRGAASAAAAGLSRLRSETETAA